MRIGLVEPAWSVWERKQADDGFICGVSLHGGGWVYAATFNIQPGPGKLAFPGDEIE